MSEWPRKKYLCTLSQLLSSKLVAQPQSQITKRLFPTRQFSRKLSLTHQRIRSSIEIRTQKYSHPQALSHHQPRDTLTVLPRSISTQVLPSNRSIKMYSSQVLRKAHCREYRREESKGQKEQKEEQATQEEKRVFLRKGSSLQKQIVLNLLKSKMRENAEECSNKEIMKLIRVYRGESESGKRGKGAREKIDRLERGIGAWQSPLEVGTQVGPLLSALIGG